MDKKNDKNILSKSEKKKMIYKNVLGKITPTQEELEKEKEIYLELKNKIENIEGKHSHLEWCGSSARNTHLRGDRDLDLFVMFDKEISDKELEIEGLKIGKKIFRGNEWEKAFSQHPYIRGKIKGFEIEIVPGFIVKKGRERKSAVDRTPFHNKYLIKNLSKKQREYARLLKQFLKGISAYGADLKNCSLPGYGIELLILYYGTFEKALNAMSRWECGELIKFNRKGKKFDAPLTIIDPVDETRNVASALSEQQFNRIKYASYLFLKNPNTKFFFPKKIKVMSKEKIKKELNKREVVVLKSTFPKNVLSDLVWGQLWKTLNKGEKFLKENDFKVERKHLWSNEEIIYFIYELDSLKLQKSKKIRGPKVEDKENIERFLKNKKNIISGPRVEEGRIVIEVEREVVDTEKALEEFVKEIRKKGKKAMRSSFRKAKILNEKEIIKEYKNEFAEFFSNYLKGKEIFE